MGTPEKSTFSLPEHVLKGVEDAARSENRPVLEILVEAVERYLNEKQWSHLKNYGHQKALERGMSEDDLPRLISEARKEHGR